MPKPDTQGSSTHPPGAHSVEIALVRERIATSRGMRWVHRLSLAGAVLVVPGVVGDVMSDAATANGLPGLALPNGHGSGWRGLRRLPTGERDP